MGPNSRPMDLFSNNVESVGVGRRPGVGTSRSGFKRSKPASKVPGNFPKRVCYSPNTGIPPTFLPQSLAKRFKSAVVDPPPA